MYLIQLRDVKDIEPIKVARLIICTASSYFDVPRDKVISSGRSANVIKARNVAMFLCNEMINTWEYKDIGELFGGRKPDEVMKACSVVSSDPILLDGDVFFIRSGVKGPALILDEDWEWVCNDY